MLTLYVLPRNTGGNSCPALQAVQLEPELADAFVIAYVYRQILVGITYRHFHLARLHHQSRG
jgi:hypothetical protein